MKEFDIELAKKGHPIITRAGQKARIICYDKKDDHYPIIALVEDEAGKEMQVGVTKEGKYYYNNDKYKTSDYDLLIAPKEKEGWQNIYKDADGYYAGRIFYSKEEALAKKASFNYVATTKVTWEE